GGPATARSDLFGLGATLYMLLTGMEPYPEGVLEGLKEADTGLSLPWPGEFVAGVPAALANVLQALLAPSPEARPATALEAVDLLDDIGRQLDARRETMTGHARSAALRITEEQKRRYKRFPTDMEVRFRPIRIDNAQKEKSLNELKNISENGAFVLTDIPAPLDSFIEMDFVLEGSGTQVHVLGVVRWRDETPGNMGMGVQFLEVKAKDRGTINRFLKRRSATESIQSVTGSALHRAVMRNVISHWDEEVPIAHIMRGTGASRSLFDRSLLDFEKNGFVERKGELIRCIRPASQELCKALDEITRTSQK
ncbi:MAG: PilZ domain-containing protein, partial [Planctomycetota bacterium]